MLNEIRTLNSVRHDRIIRLYDIYETERHINLVFEHMGGGTLLQRLRDKAELPEQTAIAIFVRMMQAVGYLHGMRIVHRDLKPDNIFLESATSDTEIKLADFGLAVRMAGFEPLRLKCGTPGYMAPEILCGETYDEKADIYSCGAILYLLYPPRWCDRTIRLTSKAPFEAPTTRDVLEKNQANNLTFDTEHIRQVHPECTSIYLVSPSVRARPDRSDDAHSSQQATHCGRGPRLSSTVEGHGAARPLGDSG